jgi:hypothetical protein
VTCAISAINFNQEGYALHATKITDFCWTLLDYASAAIEGVAFGLYATAVYVSTHPIESAISVVGGKYIAAYQLSNLLYKVLNIGITAATNTQLAHEEWSDLIHPITDLYHRITDTEIATREIIKTTAVIATSLYAQTKLISGLKQFCTGIIQHINIFKQSKPYATPQQYLTTSEGIQYKAPSAQLPDNQNRIPLTNFNNITQEVFEKAIAYATTKEKIKHFFEKPMHNFSQLLIQFNDDKKALVQKVLEALYVSNQLPIKGPFNNILVQIEGYSVCTRGFIDDNVIKIGTMFIP